MNVCRAGLLALLFGFLATAGSPPPALRGSCQQPLKDMTDIEAYRAMRRKILPRDAMPASTTVEARLVHDAYLLEVDVIAFRA